MIKSAPNILEFAEYRKYLKERYRFLKLNNQRFSHRYINTKVGVKSSGWFGDLLAGRQRLKPSHVKSVATVFKLNIEEQKCLHALVDLDVAETPEDCALAYEKWYQIKGIGQETIAKDRFKFYEKWYYSAFRELLSLYPGVNNPEILAAAFDPAITSKQAADAMKLLERLGMVFSGDAKNSRPSLPVLIKDPTARTHH